MRPAIAHIDLDAFRHNYRVAKRLHGGKALAVIKANAYGHGAVQCAKAIALETDGFAVACLEEALTLRQAGITSPILLLEGFFDASELPEIVHYQLWVVIHHRWQVDIVLSTTLKSPIHIWLKMDTGMHRVGLMPNEYAQIASQLNAHPNVASITAMSHFANADQLDNPHTTEQLTIFNHTLANTYDTKLQGASVANSAAILAWPSTHHIKALHNWARPGIMLYGANPMFKLSQLETSLRPVMQLTSRIISTRALQKGESIGYGSLFTATRNMIIGVVACGYADGYPRLASSPSPFHTALIPSTPIAVDGHLSQVIGRVSMDMLYVDLTDLPQVGIGSMVELWGKQVSANDVANAAGTIAYELFCNVKRVAFSYSESTT